MKPFQRLLVAAPAAALLPVVMAPASSLANEAPLNLESVQEYSIAQATTIRDFSDVYPTDWAYQALAKLVGTYRCVSGSPDGTFRGQQPMTRFEMAAVLSSCLDSISAKMDAMGEEMKMSAMEDMDTLERLMASFEEELITLKGSMDGLDAKVSELEDNQFSTTTKASFKIATDFTYFASNDTKARNASTEDNSGIGLSSKAEVKFTTSFTGSDKLTFKLKGDVISSDSRYLTKKLSSNFYDIANSGNTNVKFTGFTYETSLDLGGMGANLILGTDYGDFDGLVGLDTYYGGGGYDDFGSGGDLGKFGDAGIGFNLALLSSDAGTLTASASYAVDGGDAANQMATKGMKKGIFGEDTDYSIAGALNWDGALFGGNEAMFTAMFRYTDMNDKFGHGKKTDDKYAAYADIQRTDWKIVAGAYLTDTISLSGSYHGGSKDVKLVGEPNRDLAQWMVAVNLDDVIFPGNSAGIAYGTSQYTTSPKDIKDKDIPMVLELYYSFSVNDNFEVPIYLDFITNAAGESNSDAIAVAVRPTLTF